MHDAAMQEYVFSHILQVRRGCLVTDPRAT